MHVRPSRRRGQIAGPRLKARVTYETVEVLDPATLVPDRCRAGQNTNFCRKVGVWMSNVINKSIYLATPPRLERGTCGLEDRCTIQLCYGAAKAVQKTARSEQLYAFPVTFQYPVAT